MHDFFHGSVATVGLGLLIVEVSRSHSDTSRSVDSSGRVISPEIQPDNTQHSQQSDNHVLGGIRTRNPSQRTTAEPRLRSRGHRDRRANYTVMELIFTRTKNNTRFQKGCIISNSVY